MQMEPGMKMASPVACTASATAAQQRAAVQLVNASWRGAQQYRSLAAARAAGTGRSPRPACRWCTT